MAFSVGTNVKSASGELGKVVDTNGDTGAITVAVESGEGEMIGLKTFASEAEMSGAGWTAR